MTVLARTSGLRGGPMKLASLRERAARMLDAIGKPEAELSVLLCDDSQIHELNRDYRH